MRDRLLLVLLVSSYLGYATVLLLFPPLGPYSQSIKGLVLAAFILGAIVATGFPFTVRPLSVDTRTVFLLYGLFVVYSLALCFVSEAPIASLTESFKYYLRIGFLFAFVLWFSRLRDYGWVLKFPILFGVLFAIQSLILFFLLYAGMDPPARNVSISEGGGTQEYWSYGVLGVVNSIDFAVRNIFAIRLQSFFMEPSKFALFLMYPVFVAYGLYRTQGYYRYLVAALLMLLAMIGTFSLGAYAAMGLAVAVLVYYRMRARIPGELRWVCVLLIIFGIFVGVRTAFDWSAGNAPDDPTDTQYSRMLGFAEGGSLEERKRVDVELLGVFGRNPFGLSLINQYDSKVLGFGDLGTPNASMLILSRTGIVPAGA